MTNPKNHAWTTAALAICAIAWSAPGMAQDGGNASQQCSLRTLKGSYVLAASGFMIVAGAAQPKALMEQVNFNGDGSAVTPNALVAVNGAEPKPGHANENASYELDADCTGSITFASGPKHKIFMAPNGDKGWTLLLSPLNNVFPGTLTRVWPQYQPGDRQ